MWITDMTLHFNYHITSIATGEDPPYDLERDLGESESHGILAAKKIGGCAWNEPRSHGKTMGKAWENHGKMVVVQNVHGILWDLPNLVMTVTVCGIENDRRNSGFSHETWWFSTAMLVIPRGSSLKIWQFEGKTMTMETKAQKKLLWGDFYQNSLSTSWEYPCFWLTKFRIYCRSPFAHSARLSVRIPWWVFCICLDLRADFIWFTHWDWGFYRLLVQDG